MVPAFLITSVQAGSSLLNECVFYQKWLRSARLKGFDDDPCLDSVLDCVGKIVQCCGSLGRLCGLSEVLWAVGELGAK